MRRELNSLQLKGSSEAGAGLWPQPLLIARVIFGSMQK
jgi:hypothetical protein